MMLKKIVIAGTGIKSLSHLTREVEAAIKEAHMVFYLVNEPILEQWILKHAHQANSLEEVYFSAPKRVQAYENIKSTLLNAIHLYENLCVVVYGHPLFLADSMNDLVSSLKEDKTIELHVLSGISAWDCLLSDLKINLSGGCYAIEASELVFSARYIDTKSHLILWQIGMVGIEGFAEIDNQPTIHNLQSKLCHYYPPETEIYLYEASIYPHIAPKINRSTLKTLDKEPLTGLTTGYIPPLFKD